MKKHTQRIKLYTKQTIKVINTSHYKTVVNLMLSLRNMTMSCIMIFTLGCYGIALGHNPPYRLLRPVSDKKVEYLRQTHGNPAKFEACRIVAAYFDTINEICEHLRNFPDEQCTCFLLECVLSATFASFSCSLE